MSCLRWIDYTDILFVIVSENSVKSVFFPCKYKMFNSESGGGCFLIWQDICPSRIWAKQ